jgi:hypothetical protein
MEIMTPAASRGWLRNRRRDRAVARLVSSGSVKGWLGYLGLVLLAWLVLPLTLLWLAIACCWWLIMSLGQVARLAAVGVVWAYRKARPV